MENKDALYQNAHQKLTEYMLERKMRKTPERYEVLRIASTIKGLFTIDELAERMEAEAAFTVSRATLFSTMEMLVDAQLIIKHSLARAAHYEFSTQQTSTVCVVCSACGSIRTIDKAEVNKYLNALKVRMFIVQHPVLYLHGLCRKCANIKKKQTSKKKVGKAPTPKTGK